MLNKLILHGRIGKKPEQKLTQSGVAYTQFSVAVDRTHKNADGNRECDWFYVTAWRQTAEFVTKYFDKGDQIIVDGRLQSRTYTAQDGTKRSAIDLVAEHISFCGSKARKDDAANPANPEMAAEGFEYVDEEELPF